MNGVTIINKEVKYMFSLWEGFKAQLVQMYRDFKEKETAIKKLYELRQMVSAIVYMIKFQSLSV